MVNQPIITKPWKGNATGSLIISIPKKIAEGCNLNENTYIRLQKADDGTINIRKIDLESR